MTSAPVVLITGAAGNLGQAAAQIFAQQGARLALTDRSQQRLDELRSALGLDEGRCLTHVADLTQLAATAELCAAIERGFGQLDVVVHIAGGFRMSPVAETSEEDFDFLLGLNLRSLWSLARAAVPLLKQRGRGRIITIGSRAALAADANTGLYAASKAGVLRLTEALAAELRPHNITANCVLPSIIDTPQNRAAMPKADFAKWVQPAAIAEVIAFLASDAAREVSGAAVPVYGRS